MEFSNLSWKLDVLFYYEEQDDVREDPKIFVLIDNLTIFDNFSYSLSSFNLNYYYKK
jgi:hypothetical protein